MDLPIGFSVRVAIVRNVYKTSVECSYLDSTRDRYFRCPKPHPYAGRGCGIFAGIEKDTIVLVALAPNEDPFIVGTVPDTNFYFDQNIQTRSYQLKFHPD